MALAAPLAASLKAIGLLMQDAHDPWWIITSAAVALHGADAGAVADVDILLSVPDAARILRTLGVEADAKSEHPDFRSVIFGTWRGLPLPVEFMAGFSYRSELDWHPVQPATRRPVEVDGVTLFVPDREELQNMLERFGRTKDIQRAHRLAALA